MPTQTPGLDVVAPINVDVPGAGGEGWGRLQDALGVTARAYAQREAAEKAAAERIKAQGMADAQFDRVDPARMSAEDKYADGVVEYSYLGQYQQARSNVLQRASTELDQTLTVDEKAAWLDAEMDKELGSLVDQPRFREVIGPRYADFINQFAAQEITATLKENERTALDTESAVVQDELDAGTFDYSESVERLGKVIGRSAAVDAVVDIVATHAEATGSREALDLIPSTVSTTDGQSLAGPRSTPKHRDRLNLALERIQKTEEARTRAAVGQQQLGAFVMYDDMVRNGEVISEDTFRRNGHVVSDEDPAATLSVAQARSLIDQSKEANAKLQRESAERTAMVQAWRRFGSFYNAIGQDGGPKTPDEARKAYQGFVHEMLLQMTDGRETETTPVFLASPNGEGLLSAVMATSAKEGIAYEPLRLIMTAVSPAAPALVVQRLGTYKRMKAQNVAHLYVSDDAAALYEAAIVAQQAGEAPEKLQETIRRFGDADTKGYVTENAGKASLRGQSFDITVPGRFFDQSSADVFNRGYMDGRLDALVRVGLSRNLEPAQAQEFAKQRFNEAHAFLDIGGRLYAVPRTEVQDPKASTDALNWFASEVAQGLAKKTGADPAGALLNATAANGRQMQFFISDEGGNPLSGYFTLNEALQVYRKRFPSQARAEANKASAQLQQTRKRARAYQAEHAGDALPDRPGFGPQK